MSLLRLVFAAQLLVMLTGFVAFLVAPADFQTVALLFYLAAIGTSVVLYAAWQFIRHPRRRTWAGATIATPFVCLITPFLIVGLNGGPIAPGALVKLIVFLIVIAAVVLLWQKDHWREGRTFVSRRFNSVFLVTLIVLLTLYWAPVIAWLYMQDSVKLPASMSEYDNLLRIGAMYFVTVAGPAFTASVCALLYAPVGLIRNANGRLIHAGQLIMALITLASLAIGAFVVAISLFNPG